MNKIRSEILLSIAGLLVAIAARIIPIIIPELRVVFGLDPKPNKQIIFSTSLPTDVPPTDIPTPTSISLIDLATPTEDLPPTDIPTPTSISLMGLATPTEGLPPTPTGLPTDQPCEHTVQPGEWFYSIARSYNLDPQVLIDANLGINVNGLQVGDKLIIPNCDRTLSTPTVARPAAAPTAILLNQTIYTVVAGDTIGKIAAQYGVTADDILRANNLTTDALQIGQRLVIPVPPPQ